MNNEAIESVYLFIAELLGKKRCTIAEKLEYGKQAYISKQLDGSLAEDIWLERLYKELDNLTAWQIDGNSMESFQWSVPIELDASASMLSYVGVLLGDKRLLTMCNAAGDPKVLDDPWHLDGLSREHVKKVATPRLYGSNASAVALWKKAHLSYNNDDVKLINEQLKHGALGLADQFKEFVVNNCNPKPKMLIKIHNDTFTIKCNHYRNVGEVTVAYDLFDSKSGSIERVHHTKTKAVPDLERFKLYFQTLLIHNLDSQVADYVAGKTYDKYGWVLDIHDAFVVHPMAAADVRQWYADAMTDIYVNRKAILAKYFQSIGIPGSVAPQWQQLMDKVDPIEEDWVCRTHVLK